MLRCFFLFSNDYKSKDRANLKIIESKICLAVEFHIKPSENELPVFFIEYLTRVCNQGDTILHLHMLRTSKLGQSLKKNNEWLIHDLQVYKS